MTGKYDSDNSLSYRMYGVDLLMVFDQVFGPEGSLTFRAEYVFAPRETRFPVAGDPNSTINDAKRVQGAYLIVEARPNRRWLYYTMLDWLSQSAPLLTDGAQDPDSSDPVTTRIWRIALGATRRFEIGILWKFEYAYWNFDLDEPSAHRIGTQVVIPF